MGRDQNILTDMENVLGLDSQCPDDSCMFNKEAFLIVVHC